MIGDIIQPKRLWVDPDMELVKYYPNYARTLPWYQDKTLCKQVDNIDFVYDKQRLSRMYRYLSKKGECYYIKVRQDGRWHLIGDISLYGGQVALVIAPEYQNRHYGRRAVAAILQRAREVGLEKVTAEIYDFNAQSRKMFTSLGFKEAEKGVFTYLIK